MHIRPLVLAGALLVSTLQSPASVLLYDNTLGTTPGAQPWLFFGFAGGAPAQAAVPGGVNLVTTDAISAGYGNYIGPFLKNAAFPSLNRAAGFALEFELQLNQESHNNANRAGFSVILLASDLMGIELGFWSGEIWAQSGSDFLHAEGAAFDTTQPGILYRLEILGGSYTLFANGSPVLSSALRNYSAFGLPYSLPNFLFLGDNTTSAWADITLGRVELTELPEPGSAAVIGLGLIAGLCGRRFLRPRSLHSKEGKDREMPIPNERNVECENHRRQHSPRGG